MSSVAEIERLIACCAMGERSAFNQLYSATSAKLFGVCLRILNDRALAEDVLQEVYVKIWRNADRYAAGGYSPMTWLITIARNASVDQLRKRREKTTTLDDAIEVKDPQPGPEENAAASDEHAQLDACLERLADEKSKAVQMAYIEGYSYQELADHFATPLNTMRTWLRRSLQKLKECLSE